MAIPRKPKNKLPAYYNALNDEKSFVSFAGVVYPVVDVNPILH
jgi:hypothetical protein